MSGRLAALMIAVLRDLPRQADENTSCRASYAAIAPLDFPTGKSHCASLKVSNSPQSFDSSIVRLKGRYTTSVAPTALARTVSRWEALSITKIALLSFGRRLSHAF